MNPALVASKRAEYHVVAELLKLGSVPYLPAVDSSEDVLLKTPRSTYLELTVLLPIKRGGQETRSFSTADFKPDKKRFIVCVEFAGSKVPTAWVFPSLVFHVYSTGPTKKGLRNLNLKRRMQEFHGDLLCERLRGFRGRWEFISDYEEYQSFLNSPEGYEDLEDIATMLEISERTIPEGEPIPFKYSPPESTIALSR